jgi:hypothetical protein
MRVAWVRQDEQNVDFIQALKHQLQVNAGRRLARNGRNNSGGDMPKGGTCSVTDCAGAVVAMGLCGAHYYRLTKGDDLAGNSKILRLERQLEKLTAGKAARKGAVNPNLYNDDTIARIEAVAAEIQGIREAGHQKGGGIGV